jgi:WD40 repeat protein
VFSEHEGPVRRLAWSPDSKTLATIGAEMSAPWIWRIPSGERLPGIEVGNEDWAWGTVAWSPDGQLIAVGVPKNGVRIFNVFTGECVATLQGLRKFVTTLAWHPDGSRLVISGGGAAASVWDTSTWQEVFVLPGNTLDHSLAIWSPNGRILAYVDDSQTVRFRDASAGYALIAQGEYEADRVRRLSLAPRPVAAASKRTAEKARPVASAGDK